MEAKYLQLFRIILLIHHVITCFITENLDVTKVNNQHARDLKLFTHRFFTGWNMIFQTCFLLFALINTHIQINSFKISPKTKKTLNNIQGYFFTCLIAPCALSVVLMFWTLWTINRELILPQILDVIIPPWLNHSLHTVIIIPVLLEILFSKMTLPHHKHAIITIAALHVIYTAVLLGTYLEYGRWIYNVFNVLEWPQRLLFNCMTFILSVLSYYVGYKIQELRWQSTIVRQIRLHTKSLRSMINF